MSYDNFDLYQRWVESGLTKMEFWQRYIEPDLTYHQFQKRVRRVELRDAFSSSTSPQNYISDSEREQIIILEKGRAIFENRKAELKREKRLVRLAFISDVHVPTQDNQAVELTATILEDFKPDFVTGLNDFFDFPEFSTHFSMKMPLYLREWYRDIRNAIKAHKSFTDIIYSAAPNAMVFGLMGNHDIRFIDFLRTQATNGSSEYTITQFMKDLEAQGLVWLSQKQNIELMSRGLAVMHGVSAAKQQSTAALSSLSATLAQSYENDAGKYRDVVYGHDHRITVYPAHGRTAYGSGCLCKTNPDYITAKANWQQGCTLVSYDPNSDVVFAQPLEYKRVRNGLAAIAPDFEKIYKVK